PVCASSRATASVSRKFFVSASLATTARNAASSAEAGPMAAYEATSSASAAKRLRNVPAVTRRADRLIDYMLSQRSGNMLRAERRELSARRALAMGSGPSPQLVPLPPHLPVATLNLPHDIGARQSAIRSLESGR